MAIEQIGAKFFVKVGGTRYGHRDTRRAAELLEAEARIERANAKSAGRPLVEVKGPTCAEYAAEWLAQCEATKEEATAKVYASGVRIFTRRFGTAPLKSITIDPRPARAWVIGESRGTQNIVRTMMNTAMRDGLVDRNPFANLGIKQSRGRKDLTALTSDEVRDLAAKAQEAFDEYGPTMSAMILFAAYTGVRPGELFAVEWQDIGEDTLHVRQSLSVANKIKTPKNGKTRLIVLPAIARDAIMGLPRYEGMPYVFATKTGRRMNREALHRGWDPVRIVAGRHGMDFYELRHFCATYLLNLGVSHADVAVQLGHTDGGALVMSTYGHPSEDESRKRIAQAFAA